MSGEIRKLALLGGSFDPIHNGHLALARTFGQAVGADRVLLMPAKQPPHKPGVRLADERDRLAMCRLAVEADPLLEASDLEMTLPAPSYTVNTLRALKNAFPQASLFFLCGGDMLLNLDQWREYEQILQLCTVCAVPRGQDDFVRLSRRAQQYEARGGRVLLLPMEPIDVSSTEVRRRVAEGKSIDDLAPGKVVDYIARHGLYLSI